MDEPKRWMLSALLGVAIAGAVLPLVLEGRRSSASPAYAQASFGETRNDDRVAGRDNASAPGGARENVVTDAGGARIPIAAYRRIVSCSSIADAILPELVSTERIVAANRFYVESHPEAARLRGKALLSSPAELERILRLLPDLVVLSNYSGDPGPVERLRERGIHVFDLGRMLGARTLEGNFRDLATLLGEPELGARLYRQWRRRMTQVAAHVPKEGRKRALYVNSYDTQLHGGTLGSSYYDVLSAAGLVDVAAEGRSFDDQGSRAWPRYRVEDLLRMAPEIIVTVRGKGALLCGLSGMNQVPACRSEKGIVEVDEGSLNDPGPGMIAAAEAICDAVYPR
jgi:ABC-type Fe3+-hydroxamate transport system substrate-binding protein